MSYKYVSLFSGAGGLDIGLERAGFRAASLNEIDSAFCETLEANRAIVHQDGFSYFSDAQILQEDIRNISSDEFFDGCDLDLLVGGPPCQAFSSAGKQLSVLDSRGALVSEFIRVVRDLQPKVFLFENVRGIITARDSSGTPGGVIKGIITQLERLGYSVRAALLNAADYGAYQRRVRCFLVGVRSGVCPEFPKPTHSKSPDLLLKPWNTLAQYLHLHADNNKDNFTYPSESLHAELVDLPNGTGLKSVGKKEPTRPGGHWGYRQGTFIADLDLPARTVTGSASQDFIRWNGDLRRLTLEEVKGLQGFPTDWIVKGTKAQQFKQIGNAVPTLLGQVLGELIGSYLDSYSDGTAINLGIPKSFQTYIDYTIRDHNRNQSARSVHKKFST